MTPANGPENRREGSIPLEDMVDRIRNAKSSKPRETEEREYDPETGVVRVRKRRRVRKKVDEAEIQRKKRRKISFIILGTIFVIAAVFAACYGVVWGTARTDAFRKGFADTVVNQYGFRSLTSDRFTLKGSRISTGKLEVDGGSDSFMRRAEMQGFSMELELATFGGGDWDVKRCAATELTLFMVPGKNSKETARHDPLKLMAAGFLLNNNPDEISIDEFSFWNTTFIFGTDERKAKSRVNKGNMAFSRMVDEKGFFGHFGGAQMEIEGWPELKLNKCALHLQNGVFDVTKGSFDTETGDLLFEGRLPTSGEGEFMVEVQNMRLAELLVDPWSDFADGVISEGEFVFKIDPSEPSSRRLEGDFEMSTLRLFRVGFVQSVESLLIRDNNQETLFHHVSGTLVHTSEKTRIENLVVESTAGTVIEGTLEFLPDQSMKGMLMIGVPVDKFSREMPPIFKIGERGLAWTPIVLTGDGRSISDDFDERLAEIADAVQNTDEPEFPTLDSRNPEPQQPEPQKHEPGGAELFDALTAPESR